MVKGGKERALERVKQTVMDGRDAALDMTNKVLVQDKGAGLDLQPLTDEEVNVILSKHLDAVVTQPAMALSVTSALAAMARAKGFDQEMTERRRIGEVLDGTYQQAGLLHRINTQGVRSILGPDQVEKGLQTTANFMADDGEGGAYLNFWREAFVQTGDRLGLVVEKIADADKQRKEALKSGDRAEHVAQKALEAYRKQQEAAAKAEADFQAALSVIAAQLQPGAVTEGLSLQSGIAKLARLNSDAKIRQATALVRAQGSIAALLPTFRAGEVATGGQEALIWLYGSYTTLSAMFLGHYLEGITLILKQLRSPIAQIAGVVYEHSVQRTRDLTGQLKDNISRLPSANPDNSSK